MVGNGRSSFVVLAPNMSSLTVLENGGGAQERKQQAKTPDTRMFSPRELGPTRQGPLFPLIALRGLCCVQIAI